MLPLLITGISLCCTPYPRSVRLFLPDGNPTGLMIAEVVNWTGKVICAPRSRLADLLARKEASLVIVHL